MGLQIYVIKLNEKNEKHWNTDEEMQNSHFQN